MAQKEKERNRETEKGQESFSVASNCIVKSAINYWLLELNKPGIDSNYFNMEMESDRE